MFEEEKEKVIKAVEESVILMEIEKILFEYAFEVKRRAKLNANDTLEYANKIINLCAKQK